MLLTFWLLGVAALALWAVNAQTLNWRHGLGLALLAVVGGAAWSSWKNSPVGQLAWDGQDWRWESKGYQAGAADYAVSVAFDFQSLMLVRIDNSDHARLWLWAERGAFAERWLDFRRAVYSPRRAPGNIANTAVSPA